MELPIFFPYLVLLKGVPREVLALPPLRSCLCRQGVPGRQDHPRWRSREEHRPDQRHRRRQRGDVKLPAVNDGVARDATGDLHVSVVTPAMGQCDVIKCQLDRIADVDDNYVLQNKSRKTQETKQHKENDVISNQEGMS